MQYRYVILSLIGHTVISIIWLYVPLSEKSIESSSPLPIKIMTVSKKTHLYRPKPKKTKKRLPKAKKRVHQHKKLAPQTSPSTSAKKTVVEKVDKKKPSLLPVLSSFEIKKDDTAKLKTDNTFLSVLKSVEVIEDDTPLPAVDDSLDQENIEKKLSLSELDSLRQQLQQCWTVPAGALNAENLAVLLRVHVNPDAEVISTEIVNKTRMRDPYYRAAAESAQRALYHPICTPLRLPTGKYNLWRTFTITFDPSEVV